MALSESISTRPPAWEIASRAWRSVFQAVGRMPLLFVSACVLFLALQVFAQAMAHYLRGGPRWFYLAELAIRTVLAAALTAPVAVAVHRWVLLNEVQPGIVSWRPAYTRLFFLWALALRLAYLVVTLPSVLPVLDVTYRASRAAHMILWALVLGAVLTVASAYVALVFPDVALGEPAASWRERLRKSVHRLQGNFWLLVWAAIMAFLPLVLVRILMAAVVLRSWSRVLFHVPVTRLAAQAANIVLTVLWIGIAAALVSWLYSWVRSQGAEG